MSDSEFIKFKNEAERTPWSRFAEYHLALNGYDLYLRGYSIDKWEVFARGYKDANRILSGKSVVTCRKRES